MEIVSEGANQINLERSFQLLEQDLIDLQLLLHEIFELYVSTSWKSDIFCLFGRGNFFVVGKEHCLIAKSKSP
jgi:hypothetical protein